MIVRLLVIWLVTAVSLLIISKLPLGIEIDEFNTALVAALILGILNAIVRPILAFFAFPLTILIGIKAKIHGISLSNEATVRW